MYIPLQPGILSSNMQLTSPFYQQTNKGIKITSCLNDTTIFSSCVKVVFSMTRQLTKNIKETASKLICSNSSGTSRQLYLQSIHLPIISVLLSFFTLSCLYSSITWLTSRQEQVSHCSHPSRDLPLDRNKSHIALLWM